jgi:uncharacterized protein (DUF1778 family)
MRRRPLSNFVREGALSRTVEFLPDRKGFGLHAERWASFVVALDGVPRELLQILQLLQVPDTFGPSEIRQGPR